MSRSFPEFVGKVVSSIDVKGFAPNEEATKAVRIQFDDGSSLKLEFHIGISIATLGSTLIQTNTFEAQTDTTLQGYS